MALTIQFANYDKWTNVPGHGCNNVAEMHAYVAQFGNTMRVADHTQEGEATGKPAKVIPPVVTLTWEEADEKEAALKAQRIPLVRAKDACPFADEWIRLDGEINRIDYELRTLKEEMGPRPSPDLEPGELYRRIQGRRGWGYWFEMHGLAVRSNIMKLGRYDDAACVEVNLEGLTGERRIVSCRHEINHARNWNRFWWVVEPTSEEKIMLRDKWAGMKLPMAIR